MTTNSINVSTHEKKKEEKRLKKRIQFGTAMERGVEAHRLKGVGRKKERERVYMCVSAAY